MNTTAHLLLAAAVFAKPDSPKITTAAITRALLPDISLYAMAGFIGLRPNHYGRIISVLEHLMVIGVFVLLWRRFETFRMRAFYALLAILELAPAIIFNLMH